MRRSPERASTVGPGNCPLFSSVCSCQYCDQYVNTTIDEIDLFENPVGSAVASGDGPVEHDG